MTSLRTRRSGSVLHSLNGTWKYAADAPQFDLGSALAWSSASFDDSSWPEMEVPSCWDLSDASLHGYEGYVWFRREFAFEPESGTTQILWFEGVNYRADVWLNDHYLGVHEGGYASFSFDITQQLAGEVQNSLVIRVDNRPLVDRIPGICLSWFNYGGIYRDVSIEQRPLLHIADAVVVASPDDAGVSGSASIECDVTIRNESTEDIVGSVRITMADTVLDEVIAVTAGAEIVVPLNLTLGSVTYWSPEHPALHNFEISLHAAGSIADRQALRIGVRKLTTDGPHLRLNGERVQLKGFNRHEDYPTTGRAHDEAMLLADLQAIKRTGANFVRASHYPMHRRFYELCDELGIMVMDEIPLWGWGRDSGDADIAAPISTAFTQLEELILHQRNRTCVVIWSVSNESAGGQPLVDQTNIDLMRLARELDPSRLVTHVALYSVWQTCADAAMNEDDVICLNEYEGSLNLDPPVRTTADLKVAQEQLGGHLDALHGKYPDVPMVITEFGGIGLPGHHNDSPWSEEGYAATIRAHWEVFAAREWIAGGLLWCWQDYPMHPNRKRIYPLGHYGVVTSDRVPKVACLATVTELFTES